MNGKKATWIGITLGSAVGGSIPLLWGDGGFSITSMVFSALGAIIGIYMAYRMAY